MCCWHQDAAIVIMINLIILSQFLHRVGGNFYESDSTRPAKVPPYDIHMQDTRVVS